MRLLKAVLVGLLLYCSGIFDARAEGRRFGIIEVGGSGVKATVVDIVTDDPESGPSLRIVRAYPIANINPLLPEQRSAVAEQTRRFAEDMTARYGLPPLQIYAVSTSGLAGPDGEALRAAINAAIAGRAGAVSAVSATDQARLGFDGVVSCGRLAHRRVETLFIDIGSADITATAASGPAPCGREQIVTRSLGFGVKTPNPPPTDRALLEFDLDAVERPRVYLGGGIVWALATITRPDSNARFTALDTRHMRALRDQLADDPLCITDPVMAQRPDAQCRFLDVDFSAVGDADQRARVSADHSAIVSSIFTLDELRRGSDILVALSDRLRLSEKPVFFAREAVRAWALGFLLSLEAGG